MDNLVSVVIPTKNRKELIYKSIDSVLGQTVKPLEIIIVDDGSDDGTDDYICQKYPEIIVLRNEESVKGARARNQGASVAKGEYLAFLDSDDYWMPDHLETQLEKLQEGADGVCSEFFLVGKDGNKKHIKFDRSNVKENIVNKIFSLKPFDCRTSTFVFKKKAFDEVKFDNCMEKHQDWDLALNFAHHKKFVCSYYPSVCIDIDHGGERMSHKLNHGATFYFLNKNKMKLKSDSLYFFCVKNYYYCVQNGDDNKKKYLQFIKDNRLKGSIKHTLLLKLIVFASLFFNFRK